ncbi:hypothetical protein NUJ30_08785 [Burkholderia contaminans]|uniref:hypothetical protein n=1 Tax=Burkholderia TaxID=32008 RepID=UPI0010F4E1C0|nr:MULTISPECIES: hypothetical protein [Burkholderia]MBD1412789.1 hypothetical protein [Burkholderia contaminans]MBM6427845.1 hypothetical protein [Burkholderia contaminans]UXZ68759.1 hypothetical protein NUJ29_08790 [Burkholderia contaminans]UXZ76520.1 hypothetical protein NUJ30_08785 [Burkholderia contaminans]
MEEKRILTEADVQAIADALERSIVSRFQQNVGKGVLAVLWRWAIQLMLVLAAYGAGGGFKKWGA